MFYLRFFVYSLLLYTVLYGSFLAARCLMYVCNSNHAWLKCFFPGCKYVCCAKENVVLSWQLGASSMQNTHFVPQKCSAEKICFCIHSFFAWRFLFRKEKEFCTYYCSYCSFCIIVVSVFSLPSPCDGSARSIVVVAVVVCAFRFNFYNLTYKNFCREESVNARSKRAETLRPRVSVKGNLNSRSNNE